MARGPTDRPGYRQPGGRCGILAPMATPPATLADLIDLVESGEPVDYLFFWGHRPQPDGSVGPGCLSQWWPAAFTVESLRYPTAEHYMMWRKALLFNDFDSARQILAAAHPQQAKTLGRRVTGFDAPTWQRHCFDIVVAANVAKFGQHPALLTYLLGTAGRVLVEASPTDRIWGIGLSADDPRAQHPGQWNGTNLLGFALMAARTILRNQDTPHGIRR